MSLLAAAAQHAGPPPPPHDPTPGVGGWAVSIPAEEMAFTGAGYPITYRLDVPNLPGLWGQWRTDGGPWMTLTTPVGRFDGINAGRVSNGSAYLSVAFPPETPAIWLRVVDSTGVEVEATSAEALAWYDDRVPVIFTYDDTASAIPAALAVHRQARLWASIGINAAPERWGSISQAQFAADVAAGYVEPVNHTWSHRRPTDYATREEADDEVIGGQDGILTVTAMPPQSRGRVHGFIIPHGNMSTLLRDALGDSTALNYRTTSPGWTSGTGWVGPRQVFADGASVASSIGGNPTNAFLNDVADAFIAAVDTAKAMPGSRCLLYSYTYHWPSHAPGSPFHRYVTTIGARNDIWSVGYGHWALYKRTAEKVTITPPAT